MGFFTSGFYLSFGFCPSVIYEGLSIFASAFHSLLYLTLGFLTSGFNLSFGLLLSSGYEGLSIFTSALFSLLHEANSEGLLLIQLVLVIGVASGSQNGQ